MKLKYAVVFRTDLIKPLVLIANDFYNFQDQLRYTVEKYGPFEMIYSLSW